MTESELIAAKKSAQRTRVITLNSLKTEQNSSREVKMLMVILKLTHEQIMLASYNLDLLKVKSF